MCRAVILYQECSNGGQTGSKAVNKARMKIANQGKTILICHNKGTSSSFTTFLAYVKLEDDVNCWNTNFKWRYDRHGGNCNLSNWKLTRKKFRDFNGVRTQGLCVSTAVLYHLSYENPYNGSRLICSVHLNWWKEWNMKMMWTAEVQDC